MPGLISMPSEAPIITLDGPGGSGKGTVAQALAGRLGWHYLESGALYRVLGLLAHRGGIAPDDVDALVALAGGLDLSFKQGAVFLGDEEVGHQIRSEQSGERASKIAPLPEVRAVLLDWQRRCARPPGLVAEGRDMGTVVFPEADCKIYLTASVEERAQRRFMQLREKGFDVSMGRLLRDIEVRDKRDSNRPVSPLRRAGDALELDTTGLSIDDVLSAVLAQAKKTCSLRRC